jgi:predicted amidophosphoribosyltransferase
MRAFDLDIHDLLPGSSVCYECVRSLYVAKNRSHACNICMRAFNVAIHDFLSSPKPQPAL